MDAAFVAGFAVGYVVALIVAALFRRFIHPQSRRRSHRPAKPTAPPSGSAPKPPPGGWQHSFTHQNPAPTSSPPTKPLPGGWPYGPVPSRVARPKDWEYEPPRFRADGSVYPGSWPPPPPKGPS